MNMIERHFKPKKPEIVIRSIDKYKQLIPRGINTIKTKNSQEVIGLNIQKSVDAFGEVVLVGLTNQESLRYLRYISEFGTANFEYVCRQGETFPVTIGGDTFDLTGGPAGAYLHTDVWEKSLYSSIALRDEIAIQKLIQVPDDVFKKANIKPDPFDLALIQFLKGLFKPEEDLGELLEVALLMADPNNIASGRRSYAQHILLPLLPVYRCIYTADAEGEFNEVFKEAVMAHKAYWKKDERERQGWVSLPLIAAASHAFDVKGYKLNFETDYIPGWIVAGDFER